MSSPSEPFLLTTGVAVRIEPPAVPTLQMAPPASTTVSVLPTPGPPGAAGPAGDRGPAGPPGSGGSSYEHTQTSAQPVWIVDHNLGRRPIAWSLYDSDGHQRDEFLVEHPTVNRAVVRMDVPTTGTIRMI